MDGSSSLPGCDLAKMTGSIRFLYYSLSYVNLFKDRLSLSLSLSRRMLCSEKRVQRYGVFSYPPNVSKEKFAKTGSFSRYLTKKQGKYRAFKGKRRENGGKAGGCDSLAMRGDLRRIRGEKKKNRDAREEKQVDGVGK